MSVKNLSKSEKNSQSPRQLSLQGSPQRLVGSTEEPASDRTRETLEAALTSFLSASLLWAPDYVDETSAWVEHIPFAFWIVEALKPSCFVELGTHTGVSYLAFCQAVSKLGLPTRCYAVDTWKGDEHAGFYGEEVFQRLANWHDPRYAHFSRLVRSTFDDALKHFNDGSIDLLHIDGFHTYEAVKHDFETWRPKLASPSIVLFHDTNVRERNFGVFGLWRELTESHAHFEFLHGHGLGVLGLGLDFPPRLAALFDTGGQPEVTRSVRELFARFGAQISLRSRVGTLTAEVERLSAEVSARDARIDELEGALAAQRTEVDELRKRLGSMKSSASWRLTRPLRWTANASGKAFRKPLRLACRPLRAPVRWLALRYRPFTRLSWILSKSDQRMVKTVWQLRL